MYGIIERGDNHLLMHVPQAALQSGDAAQMTLTLRLDDTAENRAADGFKHTWRRYLLLTNLYQFLPGFVPVTTTYVQQFVPSEPEPEVVEEAEAAPEAAIPEEWSEAFEYAPDCRELVLTCIEAAAPPPVVGYELPDDAGGVAGAMAELAWEERQIAVFLPDQEDDRAAFTQAGWQTFDLNKIDAILNSLAT